VARGPHNKKHVALQSLTVSSCNCTVSYLFTVLHTACRNTWI